MLSEFALKSDEFRGAQGGVCALRWTAFEQGRRKTPSFRVTGFLKLIVTDLPSSSSCQGCGDQTRALITSQMVSTYTPADAWHPLSS